MRNMSNVVVVYLQVGFAMGKINWVALRNSPRDDPIPMRFNSLAGFVAPK